MICVHHGRYLETRAPRLRARLETVIQRDPFRFELRLIVGIDNRVGGGCSQRIERSHDDAQHPLPTSHPLRNDAQHQPPIKLGIYST
jgi:hypothetical protein